MLPANENINILEVRDAENIALFNKVMQNRKIFFTIVYKDVYGEKWILSNRNSNDNKTNIPKLLEE